MVFLSKLLPLFVYPLGAALLVGTVVLVLSFTRLKALRTLLLAAMLLGLWVASTPVFAHWIVARLESQHPPRPVETAPVADAIIVLGGTMSQPLPPRVAPDLNEAGDRIIEALRLYRAGKAARIVVSGGNLPWQVASAPEAELTADFLVELGAPRSALVLETESRNTRENALNTAAIFREQGWQIGLLVTSGAHMPRALATFRKAGLLVTPMATDIQASYPLYESLLDVLPDAGALALTTAGVKELIGYAVYRYRGWI